MVAGGVVTELVAVAAEEEEVEEENKEVAALNAKIKELENSNKAILENQEKQTDALSNLTDMLGTMKNIVVGDPVKKNVVRREAPKDYKDMTNFEKLKYNRDNK
jgi:flagellar motility protein MotE (MotC chaperone)